MDYLRYFFLPILRHVSDGSFVKIVGLDVDEVLYAYNRSKGANISNYIGSKVYSHVITMPFIDNFLSD